MAQIVDMVEFGHRLLSLPDELQDKIFLDVGIVSLLPDLQANSIISSTPPQ